MSRRVILEKERAFKMYQSRDESITRYNKDVRLSVKLEVEPSGDQLS